MSTRIEIIINNFVKELVEEYSGDELIKEIVVSPFLFSKIEGEYHAKYRPTYDHILMRQATMYTQMGVITIKKDVSSIIKQKEDAIKNLQTEIEALRS